MVEKENIKLDILAIGVHPDDIELCCSGTLLSHIDKGLSVGLCDLTKGELGTRGNANLRIEEAELARVKMGALVRDNLGMQDGFFRNTVENQIKIIQIIRKYKPEIVLANALSDRHPDHGRAATLISESCFYSGLSKIETGQQVWRPKAVYHYIQDHNLKPDFVVDISDHIDKKMDVMMCFKSQFFDENSSENDTPISSKGFLEFIKSRARVMGRHAGFDYAEGYNVARVVGIKNLFDIK